MKTLEIEIQPEPSLSQEEGVEVPYERLSPETLDRLIGEFVTREWEELGEGNYTLTDKIEQVRRQLQGKKAKVVYDLSTETANIVACDGPTYGKGKSHV